MTKTRLRRSTVVVLCAVYLALRLLLLPTNGYPPDLAQFKWWAFDTAHDGLAHAYQTHPELPSEQFNRNVDYPPFYVYVLCGVGRLFGLQKPDALEHALETRLDQSPLFTSAVKAPPLLFDLALGLLLYGLAKSTRRRDAASATTSAVERDDDTIAVSDLVPAAAYLLNPAVVFATAYWGQADPVHSFFVAAAFATIGGAPRRWWLAFVLAAFAALMKPQGWPHLPLLFAVSWMRHGLRRSLLGAALSAAIALLAFAPFFVAHGARATIETLLWRLDQMAYTSVDAHNVWWLFGAWRSAHEPLLGPLTPKRIGLALFLSFLAALLVLGVRVHRSRRTGLAREQGLLLSGLLALGFFMLSTHMHENHSFASVPLLIAAFAATPRGNSTRRELGWLIAAVSLGLLLNELPHDLHLRESWPLSIGEPQLYCATTANRTYTCGQHVAEWIGTLVNLGAFTALLAWTFSGGLARLGWRRDAADASADRGTDGAAA